MCTRDTTIGGVTIPAGSAVLLRLASANREDSDDIAAVGGRIVRHRHWTWGAGPHRCLGAGLVPTQLTVLISEWMRRIPDLEVVAGRPLDVDAQIRQVAGRGEGFRVRRLSLRWGPLPPAPRQVSG